MADARCPMSLPHHLNRHGGEAQHEDDKGDDCDGAAPGVERFVFIDDAGVPEAEPQGHHDHHDRHRDPGRRTQRERDDEIQADRQRERPARLDDDPLLVGQVGRASCRERVFRVV